MHLVRFVLALGLLATAARAGDFSARFAELKAAATPEQLYRFLYDLPKGGDLHNHSGGSNIAEWTFSILTDPHRNGGDEFFTRIRFSGQPDAVAPAVRFHTIRRFTYEHLAPERRAEYAALASLTPAEREQWCDAFRLDAPGEGRSEFFDALWKRLGDVLRNPQVRLELLAENIRAFAAEGLAYLETQFDFSRLFDNDGRPIDEDRGLALLRARLAAPDVTSTGLVVRFQDNVQRFHPQAEQLMRETYRFVATHRDWWVGVNIVGLEERGHGEPLRFLATLRELRRSYPALPLSLHAGEMDGADRHVRDSLLLGATRIGHGINLIKDPETMLLLQQSRRALIEINLISNRLLEYTPDLSAHPFPEYLRTGIPVCLNTDDRGMWDSNLTDEYYSAVTTFNLSWEEIVALGRASLEFAFVQPDVKRQLLAAYDARVAAFERRYGDGRIDEALARLAAVKPVAYGYARRTWGFVFP